MSTYTFKDMVWQALIASPLTHQLGQTEIPEGLYHTSSCPWTYSSLPAFRNPSVCLSTKSKCKDDPMYFWCSDCLRKKNKPGVRCQYLANSVLKKEFPHLIFRVVFKCPRVIYVIFSRDRYTWHFRCLSLMPDLGEWFEADPRDVPQEEAVELSGAVQHTHSGECDSRPHWRIHLHCIQWADGEKCLSGS